MFFFSGFGFVLFVCSYGGLIQIKSQWLDATDFYVDILTLHVYKKIEHTHCDNALCEWAHP